MNIAWRGSPNFYPGRSSNDIKHIILHHMAGTLNSTDAVFQDEARNTSAHYGVGQTEIHQYVLESNTAFHVGSWSENLQSIGIEHEDFGNDNFTDAVYSQSATLIRDICRRYGLPIDRTTIHPHKEFTPTICPGALDIDRLIRQAREEDMSTVDLYTARRASYAMNGIDGRNGRKNALDGDIDTQLMVTVNAAPETNDWLQRTFDDQYSVAYRAELDQVYKDAALIPKLTKQVENLRKQVTQATTDPDSIVITQKGWQALWVALQSFFNK